jgi:hypothetical protein
VVVVGDHWQTTETYSPHFLLNRGGGRFVDGTTALFEGSPPVTMNPNRIVVGDFNGDGRPDAFFADIGNDLEPWAGYQSSLALSTPDGHMVDATANLPHEYGYTFAATAGDFDRDGTLDLYIGNPCCGPGAPPPRIWLNDGAGHFRVASDALPPEMAGGIYGPSTNGYDSAKAVDVNGDGAVDLVLGETDWPLNSSSVLLNDGTGRFTFARRIDIPHPAVFGDAIALDIASGDINGDGKLDLALLYTHGGDRFYQDHFVQIMVNDGTGFRDDTASRLPSQGSGARGWLASARLLDLNGDGRLDLVASDGPGGSGIARFYFNTRGVFRAVRWDVRYDPGTMIRSEPIVPLDAYGRGDRDFLVVDYPNRLLHQLGAPLRPGVPSDARVNSGLVSWSASWGASSYQVWRSMPGSDRKELLGATRLTWFRDPKPSSEMDTYYVRSVNLAGKSAFVNAG